jgi:hypothetical protein
MHIITRDNGFRPPLWTFTDHSQLSFFEGSPGEVSFVDNRADLRVAIGAEDEARAAKFEGKIEV